VDDGYSDGGGAACKKVAEERGGGEAAVSVAYLQDAINQKLPVVKGLEITKQSRKGGAVHYGLWKAAQEKHGSNQGAQQ
jgi:hypothetical protein